MHFERDDAKIGLLVLAAVALFLGLVLHRSLSALVKKESTVQVRLVNVSGLEIGTEVQLQGHRVGQVNGIELQREGEEYFFLATLGLRPDIVLWKGTLAVVSSKGLGSAFIDLDLPPQENRHRRIEANEVLIGETGASLGTLITEVQGFVQNLNGSLEELKAHLKEKGLGAVLEHPQVRQVLVDLDATLIQFRKVALRGDALLKHGQDSTETLDRGLSSLERSAGMVESLLSKRSGNIDDIIGNLDALLKELQGLSTDMHTLLKDSGPELEESLKALHRNLKSTEELLEILKSKPSRVVWGTPSAAEKEAARQRVEERRKQEQPAPPPPAAP
jgi:phospholipid/cholesterol/gamma-HCH transport system substrate-binding protein